jgi:hypothetical protein
MLFRFAYDKRVASPISILPDIRAAIALSSGAEMSARPRSARKDLSTFVDAY